jgi:hypothetical protein
VGTMKNTVIRPVSPESAEGGEGHTHSVTCKLCGETVYGNSVRFFAEWIKEHRCGILAARRPPVG